MKSYNVLKLVQFSPAAVTLAASPAVAQPDQPTVRPGFDDVDMSALNSRAKNHALFQHAGSVTTIVLGQKSVAVEWAGETNDQGTKLVDLRARDPNTDNTFIVYASRQSVEIQTPAGHQFVLQGGRVQGASGDRDAPTVADFSRGADLLGAVMKSDDYQKQTGPLPSHIAGTPQVQDSQFPVAPTSDIAGRSRGPSRSLRVTPS